MALRESALKHLGGCFKGFVEAVQPTQNSGRGRMSSAVGPEINFTHRFLLEFSSMDARKDHMMCLRFGFNAVDAISHLVLADLLTNPQLAHGTFPDGLFSALVPLRYQEKLDSFLGGAGKVPKPDAKTPGVSESDQVRVQGNGRDHFLVAHCSEPNRLDASAVNQPQHPICQAAFLGNHSYVRWKLTHDPAAHPHLTMEIVLTCIWKSSSNMDTTDALDTVDLLINLGLTPQRPTNMFLEAYTSAHRQD